jgi:hypothetical protein
MLKLLGKCLIHLIQTLTLEFKILPVEVVTPVPPFNTGRAVPDNVKASVPEVVIGFPEIERNEGTDISTEVTEPVPAVVQVIAEAPPP